MVQLRHLRAGNQITAMLAIGEKLASNQFTDAQSVIRHKLAAVVDDPQFRIYNAKSGRGQPSDVIPEYEEIRRSVRFVCNAYEELGILVKQGIVDADIFVDRYSWVISSMWKETNKAVADAREGTGQAAIWENFEYLAVLSEDWIRKHPSTYPRALRPMPLPDRPPLP